MHVYNRKSFRELISTWLTTRRLSPATLAGLADVDRTTVWRILNTDERCSDENRRRLMQALQIPPEQQLPFLALADRITVFTNQREMDGQLIILDPPVANFSELARGQELLIRESYPEAEREFLTRTAEAAENRKIVLQADAEGRRGWLYFEQGKFKTAWDCVTTSTNLINRAFGIDEIIHSVRPSMPVSESFNAAYVLSRVLHIKCKILTELIVYHLVLKLIPLAKAAFAQSRALDERLGLLGQLVHDLRWEAVLLAAGGDPNVEQALDDIIYADNLARPDSLAAAYLFRDTGVVQWQLKHFPEAEKFLLDGKAALESLWDARALGPTFYVLSRIKIESTGNRSSNEARSYALAGGILDPYGFVLRNAGWHFMDPNHPDQRKELDNLLAGSGRYEAVHRVISHLAEGTGRTVGEIIDQNLSRVLNAGRLQRRAA